MTDRPTTRVFYSPKDPKPEPVEVALRRRVAELERLTADLTEQLHDRTEELLRALEALGEDL